MMRATEHNHKLLWAVVISLLVHVGLAALAGAVLSGDKPPDPVALELDLQFLAPPPPAPPEESAAARGELTDPEPETITPPAPAPPPEPEPEPEPVEPAPAAPDPIMDNPAPDPPSALDPPMDGPSADGPSADGPSADGPSPSPGPDTGSDVNPGPPSETPALAGPSRDDVLAAYQRELQRRIERAKQYPRQARLSGRRGQGVVKVRFEITGDGTVGEVVVVESSGNNLLDRAAARAVADAAPFPALPAALELDRLAVTVPIMFRLR